ncbi:hypothetical protein PFISCL1PPCAC_7182, partial [Pristionchus fissidentatus]
SECLKITYMVADFREQSTLAAPLIADISPIRELRARSSGLKTRALDACRIEVTKLQEMKDNMVVAFRVSGYRLSVNLAQEFDVSKALSISTEDEAKKIEKKIMKVVSAVRTDIGWFDSKFKSLR